MNDFSKTVLEAPKGNTYLFSVGQAGFIIKSKSGKLLAIDLYLSDCVEKDEGHIGFKRLLPKILEPKEIVFDVLIATHPHKDHYDVDSIPEMMDNDRTKLFASVDCKEYVDEKNIQRVTYVKPGDRACENDFVIDFINCDHGTGAPDAVGVDVLVDGKNILFVGDSSLRLDRANEYRKNGEIDIFVAPINGEYGNLNEEECIVLADKVDAKLIIPCHFGMFASHGGSALKFYERIKKYNRQFELLTQGEMFEIS